MIDLIDQRDRAEAVLERLVIAVSRDLRAEGEWQAQAAREELHAALTQARAHLEAHPER